MKISLTKKSENLPLKKIDWKKIQSDMREKLGSDIRQLQFVVNMDGRAVAEGVTKVNQRSTANDFAMSV